MPSPLILQQHQHLKTRVQLSSSSAMINPPLLRAFCFDDGSRARVERFAEPAMPLWVGAGTLTRPKIRRRSTEECWRVLNPALNSAPCRPETTVQLFPNLVSRGPMRAQRQGLVATWRQKGATYRLKDLKGSLGGRGPGRQHAANALDKGTETHI